MVNNNSIIDINKIKHITTINEHKNFVNSLLLLSDGRLASTSDDNTIKIYNLKNNYHCDMTIIGHLGGITYISQLKNNKLVSCSGSQNVLEEEEEFSIKIWTITQFSYQCDYTIKNAHNDCISKVISLTNNRMASCSADNTIKIWNSNYPYNLLKTLKIYFERIGSIIQLKNKEILISASERGFLCKWNLSTYQCETIMSKVKCYYRNSIIEIDNDKILVGDVLSIAIINLRYNIVENIIGIKEAKGYRSFIQLENGNILCGCILGVLCLYDSKLNILVAKKEKIHSKNVNDLCHINDHQFISCSIDDTIKVWEY